MKPYQRFLYVLAGLGVTLAFAFTLAAIGAYFYLEPSLPEVEDIRDVQLQVPLTVYTRDGRLMAQMGEKRRIPVSFEDIPEDVVNSFLAAEDDRFFKHPGVDYQGLLRAGLILIATGEMRQGGSTITMQLARNLFLTRERRIRRKLEEIFLALRIERELDKQEILTLYLNKIFLGQRAYGVAAAAQVYYGKNLNDLELAEIATIAGLPKAPSTLNPVSNPDAARDRRSYVLRRMLELDYVDEGAHSLAMNAPVESRLHGPKVDCRAPYVSEMVRDYLMNDLRLPNIFTQGYRVTTTLDCRLQRAADAALRRGLLEYDWRHGYRGPVGRAPGFEQYETPAQDEDSELPAETMTAEDTNGGDAMDERPAEVRWAEALEAYPLVGGLELALVIELGEDNAQVYARDHGMQTLGWDGLKWAKPFIDDNTTGEAPKTAAEILTPGDVIYLAAMSDGSWRLTQIPDVQGALVALDPMDGAITALAGGFDYFASKFNRVTQAKRQPGSSFKPFVYSAALALGKTASSAIDDTPVVFNDPDLETTWRPKNYTGKFFGPTRLREAVVRSLNLVTINTLRDVNIGPTLRYLERFGFPRSALPRDLSLALGSASLTPLQMASAYTTLASGGFRTEPYIVQRVTTDYGDVVYEAAPLFACIDCAKQEDDPGVTEPEDKEFRWIADATVASWKPDGTGPVAPGERPDAETADTETADEFADAEEHLLPAQYEFQAQAPQTVDGRIAYVITDIMSDVIKRGTGRRALRLGRTDLAGKTGTTNDRRDAWFSGFNADIVATAWVGFDQERPLGNREEGGRTALPMWIYFMEEALHTVPDHRLDPPDGLVTVRINPETGEQARAGDPGAIFEIFLAESPPPAPVTDSGLDPYTETGEEEEDEESLF